MDPAALDIQLPAPLDLWAQTVLVWVGFGTLVGDTQVSEDVVWAKLESMRDGAAIASSRIWK